MSHTNTELKCAELYYAAVAIAIIAVAIVVHPMLMHQCRMHYHSKRINIGVSIPHVREHQGQVCQFSDLIRL